MSEQLTTLLGMGCTQGRGYLFPKPKIRPDEFLVARTFQIVQPFAQMSVLENVMAGAIYAGAAACNRMRGRCRETRRSWLASPDRSAPWRNPPRRPSERRFRM
ncbi:MAG: hypothetical protein JWM36_1178 [Hyphomicrobiales bacterium]|nr:hypothetical protein [Hyphomicrobiales bacterium]